MTVESWVTISAAADHLSVSTKTIRRMIARGDIPAKRIDTRIIRIPVAALDELGRPLSV